METDQDIQASDEESISSYSAASAGFSRESELGAEILQHPLAAERDCPNFGINSDANDPCEDEFSAETVASQIEPTIIITRPKPFKCPDCDKDFTCKGNLNRHKALHSGRKPFACTECDAAFSRKAHLTSHLNNHYSIKPFQCEVCDASFSRKDLLKVHELGHSDIVYECQVCDAKFRYKNAYDSHLRAHYDIKPFKCDTCGASFAEKSYLKRHEHTHSTAKPFTCMLCNATFAQKVYLNHHLNIHLNLRPYKCSYCDAAFNQRCTLRGHLKIHENVRAFKCSQCDADFITRNSLRKHTRIHSNIRPYKCETCGFMFSQRGILNRHVKRIHSCAKSDPSNPCSATLENTDLDERTAATNIIALQNISNRVDVPFVTDECAAEEESKSLESAQLTENGQEFDPKEGHQLIQTDALKIEFDVPENVPSSCKQENTFDVDCKQVECNGYFSNAQTFIETAAVYVKEEPQMTTYG